ncbi:ATP-dependent endonuclease [Vibrio cyclitrophicus]
MKITRIKVKSFRTITSDQEFTLDGGVTLVGPNNSGKTNTLLAIKTFFTGYENECNYNYERDLPYEAKGEKTSITVWFSGDRKSTTDADKLSRLDRLRELLQIIPDDADEFSINVYFNGSKPVYQIHPGVKRPTERTEQSKFSLEQKKFINSILEGFQWYYIPSNKSTEELYDEFVTPFVRKKVAEVLSDYDADIRRSISNLTESMNDLLLKSGVENIKTSMQYPGNSMEGFISGLELHVEDENTSSIFEKGMGTQAAVILSSFKWITEQQGDKKVIWLIEEPETFMHPGLAEKCSALLDSLSEISTVVKTTHAINFIPSDVNTVQGVELNSKGSTVIKPFLTHSEATNSIRESLGVKFSDFFGLSSMNIFLEGETDRLYLKKVLSSLSQELLQEIPSVASKHVQFRDFTGVTDLKGFIKANYGLIRKETALVSLFDGDDAGVKCIRELAGFFGNKGGYNSDKDYVLIPGNMAIESLFPSEWIQDAFATEPVWFEEYIPAADDSISFFAIRDKSKKAFMNHMFDKVDNSENCLWSDKFMIILRKLEKNINVQLH